MLSADAADLALADRPNRPLRLLEEQLLDALAHLHDLSYLQDHPLADWVLPDPEAGRRDTAFGRAVQQCLLRALEALCDASGAAGMRPRRGYRLLTLRYVEGLDAPSVQARLAIGKSEYYRERQRAIGALTSLLRDRRRADAGQAVSTEPGATEVGSEPRYVLGRLRGSGVEDDRPELLAGQVLGGASGALPLTSLVGREREIGEVEALMKETRLLTLTGTGGVGKTRLALALADRLSRAYPDGVWLVELAALADAGLLTRAVSAVLGLPEEPTNPVDVALERHLWPRRLLLVLDNCEHLLDRCAELADRLLRRCPRIQILATSREALRIGGETRWRVPPLSAPPPENWTDLHALGRFEAIRLFVERARSTSPDFSLSPENAASVAEICWRLDGLPLSVELAAARVSSLGVEAICRRLDDTLSLLTDGSRTALPRQQTLRATIDWSHDLLSPREQAVFRRLAVFDEGSTLETIESSCRGGDVGPRDVPSILGKLVDKSLVQMERGAGETRYRLAEAIRQYAIERLEASGESDEVRGRHRG